MSRLLNRPVRPDALALVLWAAIAGYNLAPWTAPTVFAGPLALVGMVVAGVTVTTLTVAWGTADERLMCAGLWTAVVLVAWTAAVAVQAGLLRSAVLTVPWLALAAGTAWVEEHGGG